MKDYRYLFVGVLTLFLIGAGLPSYDGQEVDSKPFSQIDDSLLKDITSDELKEIIKSYKGEKAVLINVWATWCAPCVEEFPEIVKLQKNYLDKLKVIFVSADFSESRSDAVDFLKNQNVNWTTYFMTTKDQQFIESLSNKWTGALPFTKIIGKDGTVVASWEQSAKYATFEGHVKTAIKN